MIKKSFKVIIGNTLVLRYLQVKGIILAFNQ